MAIAMPTDALEALDRKRMPKGLQGQKRPADAVANTIRVAYRKATEGA